MNPGWAADLGKLPQFYGPPFPSPKGLCEDQTNEHQVNDSCC